MDAYIDTDIAKTYVAAQAHWPHKQLTLAEYPPLPHDAGTDTGLYMLDVPPPVTIEVLRLLKASGQAKPRVLDVGTDTGRSGLYLAAHGCQVTAIDTNAQALESAQRMAFLLDIPDDNFTTVQTDVRELPDDEPYDAVIASMVLHFFERSEAHAVIETLRQRTKPGGLHGVSSYTYDNPIEEATRGIKHFFWPNELRKSYNDSGWSLETYHEGPAERPVVRKTGRYLIPTIVEVVARRPDQTTSAA